MATWVEIAEFVDAEINAEDYPGGVARVLCELWAISTGVTLEARLWNVSDSSSCGTSTTITSTAPTLADFAVALSSGVNTYRLQVSSTSSAVDLFCAGAGLLP